MQDYNVSTSKNQAYFDNWRELSPMDNAILRVIEAHGGEIRQSEIVSILKLCDVSKVSHSVAKMSHLGIVTIIKSGRTNTYTTIFLRQKRRQQLPATGNNPQPINNNDKKLNRRKIEPKVFESLEDLGILDLPQRSAYARKITKNRTPKQWLMVHDKDGAIAARVEAWADFKRGGGMIDVDPIPLWLNILRGIDPPIQDTVSRQYPEYPDSVEVEYPDSIPDDCRERLNELQAHVQHGRLFQHAKITRIADKYHVSLAPGAMAQYKVKRGLQAALERDFRDLVIGL